MPQIFYLLGEGVLVYCGVFRSVPRSHVLLLLWYFVHVQWFRLTKEENMITVPPHVQRGSAAST